ncbi:MAG: response regulator, partial [Cytophagaceae bacterium]
VEAKNKEVEEARRSLEEKAEQLTLTSKYKSEFLANMSHELRTPLNSLLILAQQLYENHDGNLNDKQISFAKTIHSCGEDLIQLINDILDLSKIESGYISINMFSVRFSEITSFAQTTFKPISETKQLKFIVDVQKDLPEAIETDSQRLNQILKNMLSNAFKFTEKGEVKLKISKASKGNWKTHNPVLDNAKTVIAFAISDTGIGIPKDKQNLIFEAFQQAEGSTSRKYGGTGLGLSISRGLAELLGGSLELESEPDKGSVFTLFLPLDGVAVDVKQKAKKESTMLSLEKAAHGENGTNTYNHMLSPIGHSSLMDGGDMDMINEIANETGDDRSNILPQDKVLLVVEDDMRFAKIMIEKAHESNLKAVVAVNYSEVFFFANNYKPIAITLDVKLPGASGWRVLDLFKNDLNLRHIPIHLISGEENRGLAYMRGARSFLLKPLKNEDLNELFKDIVTFNEKKVKNVLIVEDNEIDSSQIARMFTGMDMVKIFAAPSGKDAMSLWQAESFDAIIMDYMLPDMSINDLIKQMNSKKQLQMTPTIIYSAKDFTADEMKGLKKIANNVLLKDVTSPERLVEETIEHLHINHKELPANVKRMIENIRIKEDILNGKNVLVVDDDVRNLFALTTAFERYNINAITAESGKEAISILNDGKDIDLVLMDIMMPEMDGYETTQKIRRENKNNSLPIIAVTAKAMKGDRQKCIDAGASDYITKPVKIDQLLSLMRVWLFK